MLFSLAKSNKAHLALAELERAGKLKAVVTQSIGGLHQAAGSQNVSEPHGSIHRNLCMECGKAYGLAYIQSARAVPLCACGGVVKPNVVLYQEPLPNETVRHAVEAILHADMLIIGSTSLNVYPVFRLINYYSGDKLVLINKSKTHADKRANLVLHEPIGEAFAKIFPSR